MSSASDFRHERGRVASLTRSRKPDDPELVAARERMEEAAFTNAIEKALSKAPALADERRARILAMLSRPPRAQRPGGNRANADESNSEKIAVAGDRPGTQVRDRGVPGAGQQKPQGR